MSGPGPVTPPRSPAWDAYTTEERRIRAEYLATVEQARKQFDIDAAPARDVYNVVERAAWQVYFHQGRANWQAYRAALMADPEQAPPTGPVPIPVYPTDQRTDTEARAAWQPTFTPTNGGSR